MSQSQDRVQEKTQQKLTDVYCLVHPDGTTTHPVFLRDIGDSYLLEVRKEAGYHDASKEARSHRPSSDVAEDDLAIRKELDDLFSQIDQLSVDITKTQAVNKQLREDSVRGLTELARFIAEL